MSYHVKDLFKGRDFISIHDYSVQEIEMMLQMAADLKALQKNGTPHRLLEGKTLGMIFQKASTRTRVAFEVGMYHLGGHALFLSAQDIQLGRGETIYDTGKVLARMVDGILIRTFDHEEVLELARASSVPVINGLSDLLHPTQVIADLLTIKEFKKDLKGLKMAYIGDGNNVAHSLLFGAAKTGIDMVLASPGGYEPDPEILQKARNDAALTGSRLTVTSDPLEAVKDADVVYTDVWTSMGQEESAAKAMHFMRFQLNSDLLSRAAKEAIVLHCLPAKRGQEITDEVMDGPQSVVFDQAENRLHAHKAIMALLI